MVRQASCLRLSMTVALLVALMGARIPPLIPKQHVLLLWLSPILLPVAILARLALLLGALINLPTLPLWHLRSLLLVTPLLAPRPLLPLPNLLQVVELQTPPPFLLLA